MESNNLISKEKRRNKRKKSNKFDKFYKIKADYFLQKVFDNLKKKISLNIVKYNKNIKNRIKMDIKDYKEYSEKYSSIEMEIKPVKNKYGEFINIKEENEIYYHIYFNNNKEEVKGEYKNFIREDDKIKTIIIKIDYQITSFEYLFSYCNCIKSINFKKFYRNNIDNMKGMFYWCESLKELNLNNFNSINATDMSEMFSACSSLKELNLNNFETKNVTNMSYMFEGCYSLKNLNLDNFNTNKVTNMASMFYECSYELKKKIKNKYKNLKEEAFID